MAELPKLPKSSGQSRAIAPTGDPQIVYRGVYTPELTPRQMVRRLLNAADPLSAALAKIEGDLYWNRYFVGGVPTIHNPLVCGCWITGNHKPVRTGDENRGA